MAATRIWINSPLAIFTANDLDAAGVRAAVGLATANLDTQLSTIAGYIDTEIATLITNVAAILVDTGTTLQAELDAIQAAVITNAAGVDIARIDSLEAFSALIPTVEKKDFIADQDDDPPFGRRHAHLRGSRMVVEFDEEAFQQLPREFWR